MLGSLLALILAPLVSRIYGKKRACAILMGLALVTSLTPITLRLLGIIPHDMNGSSSLTGILLLDRTLYGAFATLRTKRCPSNAPMSPQLLHCSRRSLHCRPIIAGTELAYD